MKRMKSRFIGIFLAAVVLVLTMSACSSGGTAPVLTVAGKEVTLGETSGSVFSLTEFEMTIPGQGTPIDKMPGKSWLSTFLVLKKDSKNYGYLYLYNPGREEVMVTSATIYKVSFSMHGDDTEASYWAEDNVLVNGTDYSGMDAEGVKATMSEFKALSEDGSYLSYKDGKYTYRFELDESGTVKKVEVEMDIEKSYS